MERILISQNPHWSGKKYSSLFMRHAMAQLVEKLELKEIQSITGIRRSGKSTLFKLMINFLLDNNDPRSILFLNLDDPCFSDIWENPAKLYEASELAEKITGSKPEFLFLDEVQNVNAWEKFVKSVYESGTYRKIFITGSNSTLLDGDYSKLLSGRYLSTRVYPMSFREILN
ncbi:MAG: AAA family ATPase [Candidatus Wallbacteria bacterium]|nr:AAA family ATPase [Candidatus Wallbacteria bacterium]